MGKGILFPKRRESFEAFHTLPHDAGYPLSRSHAQAAGGDQGTGRKGLWKSHRKQWIKKVREMKFGGWIQDRGTGFQKP
jgi:hypothetical protein